MRTQQENSIRSLNFQFPRERTGIGSEMLATRYEVPPSGKTNGSAGQYGGGSQKEGKTEVGAQCLLLLGPIGIASSSCSPLTVHRQAIFS